MQKLLAILVVLVMLAIGMTTVQVAGDTVPDGNGANPFVVQMAGDTVPDGNG